MHELYQSTMEKVEFLKKEGYNVVEVWECDIKREMDEDMMHYFEHFPITDPLEPRDALYGGRTNASKLYHRCEGDELIKYVDFTSLYPHVNRSKTVPIGHPEIITENFDENISNYFGLVKCTVLPPRGLFHDHVETWLHDGISIDCINIPGYNLIYKNRTSGIHGGVCTCIRNSIKFKTLNFLHHPDFEILWVYVRPKRLPRGVPCIVIGTVYHPPSADDNSMIDHLSLSLTSIEGYYPGCGIFLTGDFNRLNVNRLLVQFKMKQLVRAPTRRDQILDLIITNLPHLYENNSVEMRPPFGLSDHNVIMLHPKNRPLLASSRRTMRKRDTRSSRRNELGRYLSSCDWSILNSLTNCEDKIKLFADLISIGLDNIMPLKTFKLHINDQPWVTAEFKKLIKPRQRAFAKGDKDLFHVYRNRVNRERKSLSKLVHLRQHLFVLQTIIVFQ